MPFIQFPILVLGLLLLVWQLFSFFSLDEESIRTALETKSSMNFIKMEEEELRVLQQRLAEMKAFPEAILQKPKSKNFGRDVQIFIPDTN